MTIAADSTAGKPKVTWKVSVPNNDSSWPESKHGDRCRASRERLQVRLSDVRSAKGSRRSLMLTSKTLSSGDKPGGLSQKKRRR